MQNKSLRYDAVVGNHQADDDHPIRLPDGNIVLKQRLSLGKYFGISLYVHWTFGFVVAFAAYQAWVGGLTAVAFMVGIVLSVFLCVTLHEYGHALAARRFGIGTVDITLLPIGGVARLERMPRVPWKELVVAVAGPAVNVVIAAVLFVALLAMVGPAELFDVGSDTGVAVVETVNVVDEADALPVPEPTAEQLAAAERAAAVARANPFGQPSLLNYIAALFMINVVLVVFNMIPAFPMDGGRVLRSLLAMVMNYRNATYIASRIGLVCAVGMAYFWYWSGQESPVLLLIAVFIGYAGMSEAKQVEMAETVRGIRVRDVMIQSPGVISIDTPLSVLSQLWQSQSVTALPVVAMGGTVVGVLKLSAVSEALQQGIAPTTTAGQMADHNVSVLRQGDQLDEVLPRLARNERQLPVVDDQSQLVGILDLDSLKPRLSLSQTSQLDQNYGNFAP